MAFDISRQRADLSLIQFAEQADPTLAHPCDKVRDKTATCVVGRFSVEEAIDHLLEGTGPVKMFSDEDVSTIDVDDQSVTELVTDSEQSEAESRGARSRGVFVALAAALAVSGGVGPAAAQETDAPAALEEIVVTAQRREESLQDVPITLQAYTGEMLEDLGVLTADDVMMLAPNLNIQTNSSVSSGYQIRGIGSDDLFANAPGSVGLYMDEVTVSSQLLSGGLGIYDIERVEIVRGPQNALFGRNTTGGSVNFHTVKPVVGADSAEGYLRATVARFGRFNTEAAIGVPLGDTAAIRVSGQRVREDGIWDNIVTNQEYGDVERDSFRIALAWEPSDRTSLLFNYHYGRQDQQSMPLKKIAINEPVPGGGLPFTLIIPQFPLWLTNFWPDPTDPAVCQEFNVNGQLPTSIDWERHYNCVNREGYNPSSNSWEEISHGTGDEQNVDIDGGFVKIDHSFENVTLTSITSWDESAVEYTEDDGGSGDAVGFAETNVIQQDSRYEQWSQELRFTSAADQPFRWITGGFLFDEDSPGTRNIRFGNNGFFLLGNSNPASSLDLSTGLPPVPPLGTPGMDAPNVVAFSLSDLRNELWSVYGQIEYDFSDQMTLTFGLRYTEDTKELNRLVRGIIDHAGIPSDFFFGYDEVLRLTAGAAECGFLGPVPCVSFGSTNLEETLEESGGNLILDYRFSDALMVYGSYGRGFKSGKFDVEMLRGFFGIPDNPVAPETIDAYEIGFKGEFMGGDFRLNGAAFFYTWENQQLFTVTNVGPQFVNVPESELSGVELELQWAPGNDWFLSAGLGWIDSEITDTGSLEGSAASEGLELEGVPGFSYNIVMVKDIQVGGNLLSIQADYRFMDESEATRTGTPVPFLRKIDGQKTLNARINYEFGTDQQYELSFFGQNLTEDRYCLLVLPGDGFSDTLACIPNDGQRHFGVMGTWRF